MDIYLIIRNLYFGQLNFGKNDFHSYDISHILLFRLALIRLKYH